MTRKLLRVIHLFLLAGCLSAAPAFLTQTAHALPKDSSTTTYYSDSTHRTVVGQRIVTCNGQVFFSGQMTSFFTVQLFPC
jgi:hypothetical protein